MLLAFLVFLATAASAVLACAAVGDRSAAGRQQAPPLLRRSEVSGGGADIPRPFVLDDKQQKLAEEWYGAGSEQANMLCNDAQQWNAPPRDLAEAAEIEKTLHGLYGMLDNVVAPADQGAMGDTYQEPEVRPIAQSYVKPSDVEVKDYYERLGFKKSWCICIYTLTRLARSDAPSFDDVAKQHDTCRDKARLMLADSAHTAKHNRLALAPPPQLPGDDAAFGDRFFAAPATSSSRSGNRLPLRQLRSRPLPSSAASATMAALRRLRTTAVSIRQESFGALRKTQRVVAHDLPAGLRRQKNVAGSMFRGTGAGGGPARPMLPAGVRKW